MMTQRRLLRRLVSGAFGRAPAVEYVYQNGKRMAETFGTLRDRMDCGYELSGLCLKGSSLVLDESGSKILFQYLEFFQAKAYNAVIEDFRWVPQKTIEELKKEVG